MKRKGKSSQPRKRQRSRSPPPPQATEPVPNGGATQNPAPAASGLIEQPEIPTGPEAASPMGAEELDQEKKDLPPATFEGLFTSEGEDMTFYHAAGAIIGLDHKDFYWVLERTNLTKIESDIVADVIQIAEHGIGGPLDYPIPELGQWIVNKLRPRVSIEAGSLARFERVMTQWVQYLRQKEEEKKRSSNVVGS